MTSLVQRFGRAARSKDIEGRAILYAPPVSHKSLSNAQVRQFLLDHHSKKCLWRFIDNLFGNEPRVCDKKCSACHTVKLPPPHPICIVTKPVIRGRWPKRSKEEKDLALQELLSWRKGAFKRWQATLRHANGAETGILPYMTAKKLSQQFSRIRTAEAVSTFASSSNWFPRGNPQDWFVEIAQLLAKLNENIDGGLVPSSQPTAVLAQDLPNDNSEDDDDGSDDEEDR
jgi:hypothetical protein